MTATSDHAPAAGAGAAALTQPAARSSVAAGGSITAASGGAAAATPLSFHDQFQGTYVQQQDQSGNQTVAVDAAGSGDQPVRLAIRLVLAPGLGRRTQVQTNQATLSDSSGAPLCQGQVVQFDGTSFAIRCRTAGVAGAQQVEIHGTFSVVSGNGIQGEIDAAPLQ